MRTFTEHWEHVSLEQKIIDDCLYIAEHNIDTDQFVLEVVENMYLLEQGAAMQQPGVGERMAQGIGRMVTGVKDYWGKLKSAYQSGREGGGQQDPYGALAQQHVQPLLQAMQQMGIDTSVIQNAIHQSMMQHYQQQGGQQGGQQGAVTEPFGGQQGGQQTAQGQSPVQPSGSGEGYAMAKPQPEKKQGLGTGVPLDY
jgi:hypothetical protein